MDSDHLNPENFSQPSQQIGPPSMANDPMILGLAGIYAILFAVGLCGNTYVLTMIRQYFKSRSDRGTDNAFVYITFLCFVDLVVIITLPMTISQLLLAHWIYGAILCKIYWTFESAGKILSTFILCALSWDRYCAICQPNRYRLRRKNTAVLLLTVLTVAAFLLLLPLPYSAETETIRESDSRMFNRSVFFDITSCRLRKLYGARFTGFISYIFATGYCIPFILMTVFYTLMVTKLRKRYKRLTKSSIPLKRITLQTLALVIFYFSCWTPYWIGQKFILFRSKRMAGNTFIYVMYIIHALPYVNSSLNWFFYAMLNTQLRPQQQRKFSDSQCLIRRKSQTTGTQADENQTQQKLIRINSELVQVASQEYNSIVTVTKAFAPEEQMFMSQMDEETSV